MHTMNGQWFFKEIFKVSLQFTNSLSIIYGPGSMWSTVKNGLFQKIDGVGLSYVTTTCKTL